MASQTSGLLNQLLEKYGFQDIGELTDDESKSFYKLLAQAETKSLTLEDFKKYMHSLIVSVERELVDTPEFENAFGGLLRRENRAHLFLKARLKNYLFLESFLLTPEMARRQLEEIVARLGGKNGKS